MYFPYVRGKQFELLALKEYAARISGAAVHPIIEPVKSPVNAGALYRALSALVEARASAGVVVNPEVGELTGVDPSEVCSFISEVNGSEGRLRPVIRLDAETTDESFEAVLGAIPQDWNLDVCHSGKRPALATIAASLADRPVRHIIPAEARSRAYRAAFPGAELITLADPFEAKPRNADYLPVAAAEFSDDFLYYRDEGFAGFGDYLTIGAGWTEGGFTPRAIAIHWTYQDAADGPIMIRHFTSDSNEGISNIGRKYLEALGKLVAFLPDALYLTDAARVMQESYDARAYPGLGVIKKLSIQNHIEVMIRAMA